jgi:hypothetical protein
MESEILQVWLTVALCFMFASFGLAFLIVATLAVRHKLRNGKPQAASSFQARFAQSGYVPYCVSKVTVSWPPPKKP